MAYIPLPRFFSPLFGVAQRIAPTRDARLFGIFRARRRFSFSFPIRFAIAAKRQVAVSLAARFGELRRVAERNEWADREFGRFVAKFPARIPINDEMAKNVVHATKPMLKETGEPRMKSTSGSPKY